MRGARAALPPQHIPLPRPALEDTENVPPNGLCYPALGTYSGGSLLAHCSHLGRAVSNTDAEV